MERDDSDGSLSVEVETDDLGAQIGNVSINSQGRDFFVLACLICVLC